MPSLMLLFTMIIAPIGSAQTGGTVPAPPARNLTMTIRGPYGERFTTVYSHGSQEWICATEALPYFVTHSDPLRAIDWDALNRDSQRPMMKGCRESVTIFDARGTSPKQLKGCLSAPAFSALNHQLNELCRAE